LLIAGQASITIGRNLASRSILPITGHHKAAAPESAYVGSEEIEVRRRDGVRHLFLQAATAPFLKIDTQGYENQVLAGASTLLPRQQGVQLELSPQELYDDQVMWRELIATLRAQRIRPLGHGAWLLRPSQRACFNATASSSALARRSHLKMSEPGKSRLLGN